MRLMLWLILALLVAAPTRAQQPATAPATAAAAPAPTSSKIWIGRYQEFEEFLRTAQFVRFGSTPVGVLAPRHGYFAPGGLAAGASVKSVPPGRRDGFWESYKSEIASYKLDRLLQMDMVPPTIERTVERRPSAVQLWVESARMLRDVQAAQERFPPTEAWNRQIYRQRVFDDLTANIDDNAGNLLIDPVWNLIKIDHSRAFTGLMTMPFEKQRTRIDRPFFERLKALDRDTLRRELGAFVEGGAIDALLSRRDTIVKEFEKLAASQGEARVFLP
ncbi:MAG: hypothetical protein A3H95_11160 [Acidobacteria bacterium RIFCSPLOWO2_02_FULL_64_15]|nr:MAG: hypothetical protein A3H95_11160 [Acidobacteria bacterium RIFCSPLOWO2_02_FULL_64_15]